MDKEGNTATFGFAILMVIVVGSLLSYAAMGLKPYQVENKKKEKMQNILKAINVFISRNEAPDKFRNYVKKRIILDSTGKVMHEMTGKIKRKNEKDAFNIDVKKQYRQKGEAANTYPLYKCVKNDTTYYVVPMAGKGLWGPIWGYVSIKGDGNTLYGATFDHKTETPGLGAEIANRPFQKQFQGEKLYNEDGDFVCVEVVKGKSKPDNEHAVDGITGGTITSKGTSEMLERTLSLYRLYFESKGIAQK
ncbi:MAG: NADH:ubiquinone reductase (Na(+)-transporting) subunit C [Flavobacteriales bacterium]